MTIRNFGCVGPEGLTIQLDRIVCLVGPNNAGKSTVLRAYELALGTTTFVETDRCRHSPADEPAVIELVLHIPEGTENVGAEWVVEREGLRLLTSRWTWLSGAKSSVRKTLHREKGWEHEEKAGGADNVFKARLPQPLRVGSLDGPEDEQKRLVTALLEPIGAELRRRQKEDPDLSRKLADAFDAANSALGDLSEDLRLAESELNKRLGDVFPKIPVEFKPSIGVAELDLAKLLSQNSTLCVKEGEHRLPVERQGTGTQRALFWSLMTVRMEVEKRFRAQKMQREFEEKARLRAERFPKLLEEEKAHHEDLLKAQASLQGELHAETAKKKREQVGKKLDKIESEIANACVKISEFESELAGSVPAKASTESATGPGYMLLIDEPETAMHPNAIRAARDYLYGLASEPGWQIMVTTHSPAFVDPTVDHTTIVRLDRQGSVSTPRTFRTDKSQLLGDEKAQLKQLMHFDTGLAEVFFGGYPIVVEGDTEFAAFGEIIRLEPAAFPPEMRPVILRAYGKDAIVLVLKVLHHFKVNYSVLHDADSPLTKLGGDNTVAWHANERIYDQLARSALSGLKIVHKVSVPDFERANGLSSRSKDKPWHVWKAIRAKEDVRAAIRNVLMQLMPSAAGLVLHSPEDGDIESQAGVLASTFLAQALRHQVEDWAKANAATSREFRFDADPQPER